ncbi:MAG: hypothetical protein HPY85_00375 [Anaerolineae bacterium]|nr:hypothetical protein [Anaerolineae bacterium]
MNARMARLLIVLTLTVLCLGYRVTPVKAQSAGISLDGDFSDWTGKPCVGDAIGDSQPTLDIASFCFFSDMNNQVVYFMFERSGSSNAPTDWMIRIDVNDDGDYSDPEDRLIDIRYNLSANKSLVDVAVYDGSGSYVTTIASKADWGESSRDGGARVELGVSFGNLGILPGVAVSVTMDMYSSSFADILDTPIQWTPANALGYLILLTILIVGSIWMALRTRKVSGKRKATL